MCREGDDLHFDVRQYNCIFWKPDELDAARESLKNRILATLGQGLKAVNSLSLGALAASPLHPLHHHRNPLSHANAHGAQRVAAAGVVQLVDGSGYQAGAAGA